MVEAMNNGQENLVNQQKLNAVAEFTSPLNGTANLLGIGDQGTEPLNETIDKNDKAKKLVEDLKNNYMKIEENVEMLGYKGKIIHLDLPAKGDFRGFKFDCFVSDNESGSFSSSITDKETIKTFPNWEEKSYSINEIANLLDAFNSYMKVNGVLLDEDVVSFSQGFQPRCDRNGPINNDKYWSDTGDYIKDILDLHGNYWLNDSVGTKKDFHAVWSCSHSTCCFGNSFTWAGFPAANFLRKVPN